ncbi:MAG: hypothetical protein NTY33_00690 [Candidatus Moranbacteria bacterium]|nr:hypothetical protein [Candidatus Moranbacteria bacterium]
MERFKRKLFFWSLVLIFFIITPIIVLEARGYRFDWHRGVFVYSGTISFKSNPQNIITTLNGVVNDSAKLNRINSSFNLTGLIPMDYTIEISAPNFYPWNKKIDVHSGVSSEFWNVVLTRKNYTITNYASTDGIDKFFTSPKNRFVAFTTNSDQGLAVKELDLGSKLVTNSYDLSGWKLLSEDKKENIEWSPDEGYLSVPVEKNNDPEDKAYYIIDLSQAQNNPLNLHTFLGKDVIRYVRWDPKEKGYLFFLEGTTLFRANIKDATSITQIATDVSAYDLSYNAVYFVQSPNDLLFRTSLDGKAEKTQITNNFPDASNPTIERVTVYDESRIAFLDKNQNLFIYNKGERDTYFRSLGDRVAEMHFSNDGKKLLFYGNNEISVYYTRDWTVQPIRQENELNNVTRYLEDLKNIQWYKDYEHIIFSVGKYTKIIELDARDHRNCLDLISTSLDSPFVIHNNGLEKLFFTDAKDGTTSLNSIVFPEATPILGIGGA